MELTFHQKRIKIVTMNMRLSLKISFYVKVNIISYHNIVNYEMITFIYIAGMELFTQLRNEPVAYITIKSFELFRKFIELI